MLLFPTVYSPVRTLAKYMYLCPFWSGLEYVGLAEYEASRAKYVPFPYAIATRGKN